MLLPVASYFLKEREVNMHQAINEIEVAQTLNLSVQTLRNWRNQRKGPPYLKIGRSVRYSVEDLVNYLNSKKIVPEENIQVGGVR